ncbi:MAG: DUF2752 domain-containing protein [Planctomycetota bacterium]|nr:DUF2752 domain-containing protein [Planctomycetota bacterium]
MIGAAELRAGRDATEDVAPSINALRAPAYRRWFGRTTVCLAWLVPIMALVHPPHGLGVPVCWLHGTTGIPCPGCGLTRSLSCAVRGLFAESWAYHPFGLFFLAFFLIVIAESLLPRARRVELARFIRRNRTITDAAYSALAASFVVFGLARAAAHIATADVTPHLPCFAGL